jgi:hypothetical protein
VCPFLWTLTHPVVHIHHQKKIVPESGMYGAGGRCYMRKLFHLKFSNLFLQTCTWFNDFHDLALVYH